MKADKNKYQSRRDFVKAAGKVIVTVPLIIIPAFLAKKPLRLVMSGRSTRSNVLNAASAKPIVFLLLLPQNVSMHSGCVAIATSAAAICVRE